MIKIIGITGTLGAGKGTIVDILTQKFGFKHYSARDFITQEIINRGMPVNRDSMTLVANDLRKKHSPSYIVESLYKKAIESGSNSVIESIRTTGEIEALRKKNNFILFSVDANVNKRYNRIVLRNSETDNISFEQFLENEKREMNSDEPWKQNLFKCMELADYKFINDGNIDDLERNILDFFEKHSDEVR